MDNLTFKYNISPETISNKYKKFDYTFDPFIVSGITKQCCDSFEISAETRLSSGSTTVQLSMSDILKNPSTVLTIPIFLSQYIMDLGYYTPFDGNISQKEILNNFLFSSITEQPYKVILYNTSDLSNKKFLNQAQWEVEWGDGQKGTIGVTNIIEHNYPSDKKAKYLIKLRQSSPWGIYEVEKEVFLPYSVIHPINPKGRVNFYPQGGVWENTNKFQDYIFTGDSNNNVFDQITSSHNFKKTPFIISGFTKSRLNELATYGKEKLVINKRIYRNIGEEKVSLNGKDIIKPIKEEVGYVIDIKPTETKYIIDGVNYFDYPDGTTLYLIESSGITQEMISSSAITKDETLLKIVDKPQVWSDIFVERGKNSGIEAVHRLGEVDNLGDVVKYGYGFFNVKS